MPLSLNNSKDIVANSVSVIKGNTVVDLLTLIPTTTTTYTNAMIDGFLNLKVDDTELDDYADKTYVTTMVDNKINNLVGTAPAVLNTLQEIAAVIGDSSSIATTLVNAIADKAPKASPTFSGLATAAAVTVNGWNY